MKTVKHKIEGLVTIAWVKEFMIEIINFKFYLNNHKMPINLII